MAKIDVLKEYFILIRFALTLLFSVLFACIGWNIHAIIYNDEINPGFYALNGLFCIILIKIIRIIFKTYFNNIDKLGEL